MQLTTAAICTVIQQLHECDISDFNGNFQQLAVERLVATGKPIDELTIGEVRGVIDMALVEFRSLQRS